ncbi:glycosyltransferase [Aestuariivita boseongensis]|uniref:glycosyltransferase n=1 Tax=Aestuariivita boseongensis TaxID=1470562 RepID=UPI00068250DB|nr:nucleotide disphospho-sugar-binding domain-containing protein [Aestuariivita boseongensis]
MAHYGIVAPEFAGHLLPAGSLGTELVRRGHRVTVIASDRSKQMALDLGLSFARFPVDVDRYRKNTLLSKLADFVGAGSFVRYRTRLTIQGQDLLTRLPDTLRDLQLDGLIIDQILPAAAAVADQLDIPFVTLSASLLNNEDRVSPPVYVGWTPSTTARGLAKTRLAFAGRRWVHQPMVKLINRHRRSHGLKPWRHVDDGNSVLAQLAQSCAAFDFARSDVPANLHYVGHLSADRPQSDHGFPWDRLNGRPLIYASVGTVVNDANAAAIRTILSACVGVNAQLVIGLGAWIDGAGVGNMDLPDPRPEDAVIVGFAPQVQLIERAALVITHAGMNTTNEALGAGVPMVALPRGDDQPGVASRIRASGVGVVGSFRKSTAGELRGLIETVLNDPGFRDRARQMQTHMKAAGGVKLAADITEKALSSRQPVLREQTALPSAVAQHS